MGQIPASFCLFTSFLHNTIQMLIDLMVCLGLEPGAAEWKAQTNPLSYGVPPRWSNDDQIGISTAKSL